MRSPPQGEWLSWVLLVEATLKDFKHPAPRILLPKMPQERVEPILVRKIRHLPLEYDSQKLFARGQLLIVDGKDDAFDHSVDALHSRTSQYSKIEEGLIDLATHDNTE